MPHKRHGARQRLLNSASRLFFAEGFQVGIDRIIADATVAKASFYAHFPSRSDLEAAVIEAAHAEMVRELNGTIDEDSLLESIRRMCEAIVDPERHGALVPQALATYVRSPDPTRETAIRCERELIEALERACHTAAVVDPAKAAKQLAAAILGFYLLAQVVGEDDAHKSVSEVGALLLQHHKRESSWFTTKVESQPQEVHVRATRR